MILRAIQRIDNFHIVQGIAIIGIRLNPNGVSNGSTAIFIRAESTGNLAHDCTGFGGKVGGIAVPLIGLGINSRCVLEIALGLYAGVFVLQLDPIGQRAGLVGIHATDDPNQRAGSGIRRSQIEVNCSICEFRGGAGLLRAVRIVGGCRCTGHAHIFLNVRGTCKGIHYLDLRAAVCTGRHGQGVGEIIAVRLFRDSGDGLGNVHIAVLRNDVVRKVNRDRYVSNHDFPRILLSDL